MAPSKSETKSFALNHIARYITIAGWLKACPFTWPQNLNLIKPSEGIPKLSLLDKGWEKFLVNFCHCWLLANAGYLWLDTTRFFPQYVREKQWMEFIFGTEWIFGYGMVSVCCRIHHILKKKEMATTTNQLIQYIQFLKENDAANAQYYNKSWRRLNLLGLCISQTTIGGAFLCASVFVLYPHHRPYWHLRLFPPELQINSEIKSIFFLYELALIIYTFTAFFSEAILTIFYIDTLANATKILKRNIQQQTGKLNPVSTYKQLRLLCKHFEVAFGGFGLPAMKGSCTLFGLLVTAAAIHWSTELHPILVIFLCVSSITSLAILGLILPTAACVHVNSLAILGKFKEVNLLGRKHINWFDQVLKGVPHELASVSISTRLKYRNAVVHSCIPFSIKIGQFYHINRLVPLTFYTLFFRYLLRILIAFSSNSR